jgi:predicted acyltransferase (DUF342 family)
MRQQTVRQESKGEIPTAAKVLSELRDSKGAPAQVPQQAAASCDRMEVARPEGAVQGVGCDVFYLH